MILGQAVFGEQLPVGSLEYFQKNLGKVENKAGFLTFL